MRCPFRPDEQQHAIDQRSNEAQAQVEVRPEVAGTIDFVSSDQRNETPKGRDCGKTSRIAHGNAGVEDVHSYHGSLFVWIRAIWEMSERMTQSNSLGLPKHVAAKIKKVLGVTSSELNGYNLGENDRGAVRYTLDVRPRRTGYCRVALLRRMTIRAPTSD